MSPSGALSERVRSTVKQRARLFEGIAPVRRAAAQSSEMSPTLARRLESSRVLLRGRLSETFSKELARQDKSCDHVLDALEVAMSFETWDQLRRLSGRSVLKLRRSSLTSRWERSENLDSRGHAAFATQQDRR